MDDDAAFIHTQLEEVPAGLQIESVAEVPLIERTRGDVGVALTVADAHDVNVGFAASPSYTSWEYRELVQIDRLRVVKEIGSGLNAGVVIGESQPEFIVDDSWTAGC